MNKRKFTFITIIFFLLVSLWPTKLWAASNIYLNEKASVSISQSWSKSGAGFYTLSYRFNDEAATVLAEGAVGDFLSQKFVKSFSTTATFTPKKAGKYTIILAFDLVDSTADANEFSVPNKTVVVEAVQKPVTPKPPGPVVDKDKDKYPSAEELAAQALVLKKLKPLVKSVAIISESEKYFAETLTEIKTEPELFLYSYKLPSRVDEVSFKFQPIANNVVISGDLSAKVLATNKTQDFTFKLKDHEIEQTLIIRLEPTLPEYLEVSFQNQKFKLYDDELLDAFFARYHYNRVDYTTAANQKAFYYELNTLQLQLLVDATGQAEFYRLDDNQQPVEPVVLLSNNETLLVVSQADSETAQKTINQAAYKSHEVVLPADLLQVDSTLTFKNQVFGWAYNNQLIVFGQTQAGNELYLLSENSFEKVVVAFDEKPKAQFNSLVGGLIGLNLLTASVFIGYVVKESKWKKQNLKAREIRKKLANRELDDDNTARD